MTSNLSKRLGEPCCSSGLRVWSEPAGTTRPRPSGGKTFKFVMTVGGDDAAAILASCGKQRWPTPTLALTTFTYTSAWFFLFPDGFLPCAISHRIVFTFTTKIYSQLMHIRYHFIPWIQSVMYPLPRLHMKCRLKVRTAQVPVFIWPMTSSHHALVWLANGTVKLPPDWL